MSQRTKAEIALAIAAIVWGSTFVVVKDALRDVSPVLYLAIRFGIAALLMAPLLLFGPRPTRRVLLGGVATGGLLGFGMILQTVGLKYTSAANSGFLTSLYIPLVPFVAAYVYGARTGIRERIAVAVASLGIALMSFDPASLTINLGDVLTIGCAIVFSFQIVMVKQFASASGFAWLAWLQIAVTAVIAACGAGLGVAGLEFVNWTPRLMWALAITIAGATVLAFLLQSWGQRNTTASRAALVFATEPVFAGLASYFWLGERLTLSGWVGAALVFIAIILAELKPRVQS